MAGSYLNLACVALTLPLMEVVLHGSSHLLGCASVGRGFALAGLELSTYGGVHHTIT